MTKFGPAHVYIGGKEIISITEISEVTEEQWSYLLSMAENPRLNLRWRILPNGNAIGVLLPPSAEEEE